MRTSPHAWAGACCKAAGAASRMAKGSSIKQPTFLPQNLSIGFARAGVRTRLVLSNMHMRGCLGLQGAGVSQSPPAAASPAWRHARWQSMQSGRNSLQEQCPCTQLKAYKAVRAAGWPQGTVKWAHLTVFQVLGDKNIGGSFCHLGHSGPCRWVTGGTAGRGACD